jgi:hypothetical protein
MPSTAEIVGILVAILVIWFVLKMAKLALRLMFFIVAVLLVLAVVYFVFMR